MRNYSCVVVLGPTAVGKTSIAVNIADRLGGEVISADSRQVYRGLDIGSGKDLCDFTLKDGKGERTVPYHLIDITDLKSEFSVFDYQAAFYSVFPTITERGVLPVVCGGTGMYLDAVVRGYDLVGVPCNPALRTSLNGKSDAELVAYLRELKAESGEELHNTTDTIERHRILRAIEIAVYEKTHGGAVKADDALAGGPASESGSAGAASESVEAGLRDPLDPARAEDKYMPPRPDIRPFIIGTTFPRDMLRAGIKKRLVKRFDEGMIDEVAGLHENGASWDRLERLGLEYRFISEYLEGKIKTKDELVEKLYIAIGQFAKRQETWFRRMEKQGTVIHWLPYDGSDYARSVEGRTKMALKLIEEA